MRELACRRPRVARRHRRHRVPRARTARVDSCRTAAGSGRTACPACGAFERVAAQLRAAHHEDVALVFRHWPLPYHHLAYPVARASECAGNQGQFESFHDVVYAHQDSLGVVPLTEFARRAHVPDLVAFDRCASASQRVPAIERDIATAQRLGSRGTPTLIVNGSLLEYLPTAEQLEDVLRNARPQARAIQSVVR
jgi:protein-disulfide isomerase